MAQRWLQVKGDPSIRRFLFAQSRQVSALDCRYDAVMNRALKLFGKRGVFHLQVHFSSSQLTTWSTDNPYGYEVAMLDEFLAPDFIKTHPDCDYPRNAIVRLDEIEMVLERFGELRTGDDTVYLRSGSLNIMNGCVGLTFSCDGSHYLDYRMFLESEQFAS